jgi:hypothetical protein
VKTYLGDSVYADRDNLGRVVLTTENGYHDDPRNRIVLEPEVFTALIKYVESPEHQRHAE